MKTRASVLIACSMTALFSSFTAMSAIETVDLVATEPPSTMADAIEKEGEIEFRVTGVGRVDLAAKTVAGGAIVYKPVLTNISAVVSPRLQLNVWHKAFDNASLDEYEPYALDDVNYVKTGYNDRTMPLYSSSLRMESATNGVCQFIVKDTPYVKCLKVAFLEKEDENGVKSIWICNTEQWYSKRDDLVDFDTLENTGDENTGKRANTLYCLGTVIFTQKTDAKREVRHLKGLYSPNLLRVESGVQVVACGSDVPVVQWEIVDKFTLSGGMDLSLTNVIKGSGTLYIGEAGGADTVVTFSGENAMTGQEPLCIRGTATFSNSDTIPKQGTVTISGTCNMEVSNFDRFYPAYRIEKGGVLTSRTKWGLSSIVITNVGGTVNYAKLDLNNSVPQSCGTYPSEAHVHDVTLEDGARMIGACPRFQNGTLRVRGTAPSTNEAGLVAFGVSGAGTVSVLDVADVTGNDEADLVMTGPLCTITTGNFGDIVLRKTGSGTVRFDHVCPINVAHPVEICGGTWLMGVDDALPEENDFVLEGGAFAVAPGVACDIGTLALAGDSSIVVGEGGSVGIKDSSAVSWGEGMTLNVIGAEKSVRFGTSSASLTAAQVASLRLNGKEARLDRNGYVTGLHGLTIFVR